MEERKDSTSAQSIIDQLKIYLETRITLAKYKAVEKGTSVASAIIIDIILAVIGIVTFLFASITLALYLGDVFESYWKGFGAVSIFYLIMAVVIVAAKRRFERPIINRFIRKIFK